MQHIVILLSFLAGGFLFVAGGLTTWKLLRKHNPNPEKNTIYECGEEPAGPANGLFNFRFYVIAVVFLLFEAELVFLFPWSVVWLQGSSYMQGVLLAEALLFFGVLALGLVFAWRGGYLQWDLPKPIIPTTKVKIHPSQYQKLNTGAFNKKP